MSPDTLDPNNTSWSDQDTVDTLDPSDDLSGSDQDTVDTLEDRFKSHEIASSAQRLKQQKILFRIVLVGSVIFLAFSVCIAFAELSTVVRAPEAVIIGMLITAPIILILALLRYVYDGSKSDDPQPTLMLNVGKELAGVLQSIFKK